MTTATARAGSSRLHLFSLLFSPSISYVFVPRHGPLLHVHSLKYPRLILLLPSPRRSRLHNRLTPCLNSLHIRNYSTLMEISGTMIRFPCHGTRLPPTPTRFRRRTIRARMGTQSPTDHGSFVIGVTSQPLQSFILFDLVHSFAALQYLIVHFHFQSLSHCSIPSHCIMIIL